MKSNATAFMAPPFDTNPLTKMWHLVITSWVFICNFLKYVKLAKMAMMQIVGNVKDEHNFSTLAFMKLKFFNMLTTHLPIAIHMFAQQFYTLQNFSYAKCIEQ
jgi:hypothetical protein